MLSSRVGDAVKWNISGTTRHGSMCWNSEPDALSRAAREPDVYVASNDLAARSGAVNLGQAVPASDAPAIVVAAATRAMAAGHNQYAPTIGTPGLRAAVAATTPGANYDPEDEVTITAGATEAIVVGLLACVGPGDEVLVPEPFYDAYPPIIAMTGARMVAVPLCRDGDRYQLDIAALAAAVTPRTRALLLNNPHNPTGMVIELAQLTELGELARQHDLTVISDEVYEHLTYSVPFVPVATVPALRERAVTCSSASKSLNITGWRVGWASGPAGLTRRLRHLHRFISFCAPTPMQEAVAEGLWWAADSGHLEQLRRSYAAARDRLLHALGGAGFTPAVPDGGIVLLAHHPEGRGAEPSELGRWVAERFGIVGLPTHTFHSEAGRDRSAALLRFSFARPPEVLTEAITRLSLPDRLHRGAL